jgi:hypothetical protein
MPASSIRSRTAWLRSIIAVGQGAYRKHGFIVMPMPAVAPSISSVLATNPPSLLTWLAFHPSPAP